MTTATPARVMLERPLLSWRRLARLTAAVLLFGHLIVGAVLTDLDAVFIAISFAVALVLTRIRRGTVGWVLLALCFANVAFWTTTATYSHLSSGAGFLATALASIMATSAVVGLVAGVATLAHRSDPTAGQAGPLLLLTAGAMVLAALLAGAALSGRVSIEVPPDATTVVTDRTAFIPDEIEVAAGEVTFVVENRDYFWHTWTVQELGIDVRVPVGATRTVTVDVPAGTYDFTCDIPGHVQAGMVGVLVAESGR
jgi:plastocyanin